MEENNAARQFLQDGTKLEKRLRGVFGLVGCVDLQHHKPKKDLLASFAWLPCFVLNDNSGI